MPPPQSPTQKVGNLPRKKRIKKLVSNLKNIGLHQIKLGHFNGHFRCPYCWCQAQDLQELRGFHQWLQQQPPGSLKGYVWIILNSDWTRKSGEIAIRHKHKLLVAGNHAGHPRLFLLSAHWEPTRQLADPERHEHMLGDKDGALKELKVEGVRQVLPKCTYLQDGMIFFMCFAFRMWFVAFNSPLIF